MIDITKMYSTRNGMKVRIYAVDGQGKKSVHGAYWDDFVEGWVPLSWTKYGKVDLYQEIQPLDLIEVRPRHKRTVWVTVYPMNRYYISDENIQCDIYPPKRIACIKVELDFEEGEGL